MSSQALTEMQLRRLLEVGQSLVAELDTDVLLERILSAAKDLTGARYAALGILDLDKASLDRFLYLGIDQETASEIGPHPEGRGVLGELIRNLAPLRLSQVSEHPRSHGFPAGHPHMDTFVGMPIEVGGEAFGNIYLTEKIDGTEFDEHDEAMLLVLSESAAIAIDNARTFEEGEHRRADLERTVQAAERDRRRMVIDASERERRLWAMELHDQTLQDLGALKVMLEGALSRGDPETMRRSLTGASSQLEETIASLESLIHELRPPTLDALGVAAAVETLVEGTCQRGGIRAGAHIDLAHERGESPDRLAPVLEATIYRVIQEALNNAVKHSEASKATVSVTEAGDQITIFVEDDGKGFSPAEVDGGRFGLHGMRERIDQVDGHLEIDSAPGQGARLEIHLPVTLT